MRIFSYLSRIPIYGVFYKEAKITEFTHCLVLELYTTNYISFDYSNLFTDWKISKQY